MDFGRPNVEVGWKMANGQLLFLALHAPLTISARSIQQCHPAQDAAPDLTVWVKTK